MSVIWLSIIAIVYLSAISYLGFRGYKATKSTSDYLVAGRKTHPYIMALSYGATFISTSAIVGFGGAASVFGMGLLWLTVLNIAVGILIAFVFFGRRTRRMGHRLQAHTFPELLGKRFNSRFVQAFSGLIIVTFMPLYAAAVLVGAAHYIGTAFGIPYEVAVTVFSLLIAGYVVAGGLKSVMYTDALQGTIMFVGMIVLIIFTYGQLGGVSAAHKSLGELPAQVDEQFKGAVPDLLAAAPEGSEVGAAVGWFAKNLGELKKTKEMEPAEAATFLEANPDVKATAGLLKKHPVILSKMVTGKIGKAGFQGWTRMPVPGSNFFYVLVTSIIMGVGIGVLAQPQLAVRFMTVKSDRELNRAVLVGGVFILAMTGVAFVVGCLSNVWFARPENGGMVALAKAGFNTDVVIPEFINSALPGWFGAIFMLTLLSAAMSTLSSQFHAMGTSIGRDFFEKGILGSKEHKSTILITRVGIILGILATVLLSFNAPVSIIAPATAIFFGLCAAAFLPMYIGGLYWKRMTKAGAIASLCTGFGVSFFWLMFVQQVKGKLDAVLARAVFDVPTLLPDAIMGIHWNWVEALFIGLPASAIVAVVVSLLTQPESDKHTAWCFEGIKSEN
jgi:solute:Na+ symporter, SSS family